MRADRLLAVILLLQAKGRVTAAELATHLEVSVRTIYRDITALQVSGVPVYADSGPGGGCHLLHGYKSPLDALTPEEADALLILGVPQVLRDLGLGTIAHEAQQRVADAAAPRSAVTSPLVHVDMPRWFHAAEATPHLVLLARAARAGRRVSLAYGARDRPRSVDPLGLVNKAGIWYLVATTTKGPTVFRLRRVRRAVMTDEKFERPPGFDLEAFWDDWSADFVSSRPRISVTVRLSPLAISILPELVGDAARDVIERAEPPDQEGWRLAVLSFEHHDAAVHRLAGFGALVEVVAPADVRRQLITVAEGTLRMHRSGSTTSPG